MTARDLTDYPESHELEAEYTAAVAALERAYLAILNMEAHGTPIPMDVRAEAESWIGERAQ